MKNHQLCSSDESTTDENQNDDYSSRSIDDPNGNGSNYCYCWWRAAAAFDDVNKMTMMKPGHHCTMILTAPRMRVLRELERLALVATHEGLNELKHKLLMYRSGDFWMPTGGISKENMDIPPLATILLVGFSASGKSSLVNLMYSVLGRSGLIPFAQTSPAIATGRYHTRSRASMILKEHNVLRSLRSGFCVYDSRGFNYDQMGEGLEDLSGWMSEGVHHNQVCLRAGDAAVLSKHDMDLLMLQSPSKFVRRRVNCVMVVANMAEIYKAFQAGDIKPMEATRQLFCSINSFTNCNDERPMLILTHGDMLSSEERIEGRLKICECLGVSETSTSGGVYDIVSCLTEYGFLAEEADPVSAYSLTEALYRALLISDRTHSPKKTLGDWALLILSWIMCFLGSILGLLAQICLKLGRHRQTKDI